MNDTLKQCDMRLKGTLKAHKGKVEHPSQNQVNASHKRMLHKFERTLLCHI